MFYEKTGNNFLNCELKIIYAKIKVNNLLNSAELKIISCKILEIVCAENSVQFLCENSEQFYLIQKIYFMNAVSKLKYTLNMM